MNDPDTPEIPLIEALKRLRTLPDFQEVVEQVRSERETWIKAMDTVTTPHEAMKHCGSIVAVDLILDMLTGEV